MLQLLAIAQIPHEYKQNLTVFHVNEDTYGTAPINMDTGNARGDMYFDIRSMALPIECKDDPSSTDCDNAEVVSKDLVITKLVLEIDTRFGDYGRCNVCINGTDHHGNNSCVDGVYWCSCGSWSEPAQCPAAVGRSNITEHFGQRTCKAGSKDYQCWHSNSAKKTGGLWFSTDSLGFCGDGSLPPPAGCTWRVAEAVKRKAQQSIA
jgi:hypothetical protein